MYPSAKRVSPLVDYVLFIEFDNDESGHLDMKPFLNFGLDHKPGQNLGRNKGSPSAAVE